MKFLLSAKHWQVFPILITGLLINNTYIEGYPILTSTLSIVGFLIYYLWPMLIGHALQDYLPRKVSLNYNLFLINGFISLAAFLVVTILTGGEVSLSGLAVLPGLYVFYAFLYYQAFPAKTLRSIEYNKEADFGEYIGDFFLILLLPIGIWFLQPRINQVVNEKYEETKISKN